MFRIAYSKDYCHPLPEGHRFPMLKYDLIPEQLVHSGLFTDSSFFEPSAAEAEDILRTHTSDYLEQLEHLTLDAAHVRRIGFPLSEALIQREKKIIQGTLECAYAALKDGVSMNVAGGTHHAFSYRGEGFCMMNDQAFAANILLADNLARRILIVDLDVHQGNGTAQIFQHEQRVFTFSMHGADNYPFHKEQSDLDIPLQVGTDDATYLELLNKHLNEIIEKFEPDFIFYQCGADILETDRFGKLGITPHGCKLRDRMVFKTCKENSIPVVASMGGGYSPRLSDIVNAHCNTFEEALRIFF